MSDMSEILRNLVRRWWVLCLFVVLGAVAGLGYAEVEPTTFTAQAYVAVSPTPTNVAGVPPDDTLAVNFAQAYGRVIEQADVMVPAAKSAGFNGSFSDFGKNIQASTSPDAPIVEIVASAGAPDTAAAYANAVANSLVAFGTSQSGNTRVNLTVLSSATPPAGPSSPQRSLDTAIGAAAGVLIGVLATMARGERGSRSRDADGTPNAQTRSEEAEPSAREEDEETGQTSVEPGRWAGEPAAAYRSDRASGGVAEAETEAWLPSGDWSSLKETGTSSKDGASAEATHEDPTMMLPRPSLKDAGTSSKEGPSTGPTHEDPTVTLPRPSR